ncbi:MAG: Na/Pi cotransporter family protein [Clostridiales bacterium]|nr:Na/Pi cotransporter family protein [Candidatus Cacconaster stercorequi]
MGIANIVSLLGGLALFLYGIILMGDGLNIVAGNKLEVVLYRLTSSPLKGILLGTGVTALIQSSSATSVMVIGFVNSGMMQFRHAISIILGSILGTSITGWIICLSSISGGGWVELFSSATITGLFAIVGIYLRKFSKKPSNHQVGNILLGFAVLMYGMSAMSAAVTPLRESASFISLMTKFSNPALGILVGMVFTAIIQSSAAAVGILQALAMTGALSFSTAYPIILGIAVGGALPVLISSLGANINGKRTAVVHLLIDIFGAVFCGVVFYAINALHPFSFLNATMSAVTVAALNTMFRLVTVVVLFPVIRLIEKLACMLVREKPTSKQPADLDMDRLEERFLTHPALAIEQSRLVTNSMAEKAQQNIMDAIALRSHYTADGFRAVAELEETLDRYEDKLGTYLMKITSQSLTTDQSEAVSKFLHNISDFERISDHALNIAESAREIKDKNISFSDAGAHELTVMEGAVTEILYLAIDAFINGNILSANRIEPLEEIIDGLCDEMKLHHVERLRQGQCTYDHGFVFNDLVTNYERVADHCSNIGVAMIELQSDDFDTHEYLNSLREVKSETFAKYYDEYRRRFSL